MITEQMPDTLGVLLAYLDSDSSLAEVETFSIDLTGYQAGDTWVKITETPGEQLIEGFLASPNFDFNVYGPSIEDVRRIAMKVQRSVVSMKGHVNSTLGAVVTNVRTSVTPFDLTDIFNNQPRYVFSVAITVRPL